MSKASDFVNLPRDDRECLRRSLKERLAAFLSSWPPPIRDSLTRYLAEEPQTDRTPVGAGTLPGAPPYWMLLPLELARKYNVGRTERVISEPVLEDFGWGQYCLFLAIRIQDDILDRPPDWTSLIFVTDALQAEAQRTFRKHFAASRRFWELYIRCLETTARGISLADDLARTGDYDLPDMLRLYAEIASILRISSAAVCLKAKRSKDLGTLFTLVDALAIFGQIIDDLEDINEDLVCGHYNYVAACLLQTDCSHPGSPDEDDLTQVARHLVYSAGMKNITIQMRELAAKASNALSQLGLPLAEKLPQDLERKISDIEKKHHRMRCETVFGRAPE